MKYKLISHRVNGFGDGQLQQFERQVQREIDSGAELLGGPQVNELPNGYQITQAVLASETSTRRDRRGG